MVLTTLQTESQNQAQTFSQLYYPLHFQNSFMYMYF